AHLVAAHLEIIALRASRLERLQRRPERADRPGIEEVGGIGGRWGRRAPGDDLKHLARVQVDQSDYPFDRSAIGIDGIAPVVGKHTRQSWRALLSGGDAGGD